MRRCLVSSTEPEVEWLRQAAGVLRVGGAVAYPTDTLYGLAVDPRSEHAVLELYRMKGRWVDKAIPLVAADRCQIEHLAGRFGSLSAALAEAFWPGPLSLVIPAWPGLASPLLAGRSTVVVRVPAHPVARGLARALGHPVTSTSANASGESPAWDPDAVAHSLGDRIALLLDGGRTPGGAPSTIVDATGGRLVLVRAGAVSWESLLPFEHDRGDLHDRTPRAGSTPNGEHT
ncbi:MAG: L-threonylcarbamoyladenylate synthase [Acidobacteriota bacterium]